MPITLVREVWPAVAREIIALEWHQLGESIILTYNEGEPECLVSTEALARDLAQDVGLDIEVRIGEIIRWSRIGPSMPYG